jgi:glyoxylase-like metal-dependent hydrolase (beta-lactamase superfamily II)
MHMFEISRRDLVLSAAGAYAAFGLSRPVAFIGAAQAQQADRSFSKHKVGDIEVTSLIDGGVEPPVAEGWIRNATAEQIKEALRAGGHSDARIPVPFTAMAAKIGGRLVLFDTGAGGFPVYGPKSGQLSQSMIAAGLDPKDVKTIVITHLHGDHIYGLMDKNTGAQIYPNAEIIVPEAELKWWTQPGVDAMQLGRTREGLAQRIRETLATWKNLRSVASDAEVIPGVRAVPTPGHSPAHTAYVLSSKDKQLFVTADVSLLPALFARNPEWQVNLDQDPAMAAETRKKIFERAIADKAMITGTHWMLPNIGALAKDGSGYAFVPAVS